ncbi:hypothetical protein NDS46_00740 [Paenibacillus thiaminolyticus]|uniref:hypothetical protein n=1 Tax=Paenibacillus thiaminolyticus TaxID=49283 RepID=UPI00232BB48D|nr:hypothetical protein [Paenibacillus thiaminolyticus]WCF08498.1 hypothetical protein NDS46_00740 [Paenibacillus thiaminolyticus]
MSWGAAGSERPWMGHAHTIAANWPDGLPSRRAPSPGDTARQQLLPERLFLFQAGT